MKNGKRPTRLQKLAMKDVGLTPDSWLVYKVDTKFNQLHITHRYTGTVKVIPA